MIVNLIIAFNLGLFSTLHCVGMCGGFLSTLMLASSHGDDKASQGEKRKILRSSFAYNFGRISSYSIAGFIMGLFGFALSELLAQYKIYMVLQILASLILIAIALNILGVFSLSTRLENIGTRLWKHIQPLAKGLLPVDSFGKAYLFGMVWGWLPCGMVYSALLFSLTTGSAFNGMLTMLFFGLGTLPAMISAGYFVDYLNQFRQHKQLRWFTAIVLIMIAVTLPLSMKLMPKHQHQQSSQEQNEPVAHSEHMHHQH
jgi:sulfite exporter TauE/SafE